MKLQSQSQKSFLGCTGQAIGHGNAKHCKSQYKHAVFRVCSSDHNLKKAKKAKLQRHAKGSFHAKIQDGRLDLSIFQTSKVIMLVEPSNIAHLKGIGTSIHIKFEKFIFPPKSATRGRFSSAIARKHGNRHKIKTKAHTRVIEVSIPMFSWSQNLILSFKCK